jgi:hypothetical protein
MHGAQNSIDYQSVKMALVKMEEVAASIEKNTRKNQDMLASF